MRLIAIGGGGFTNANDPGLDDFVLSRAKGNQTRFGFITTASDHDPIKIDRLNGIIAPQVKSATHLSPESDSGALATWIQDIDLLYIGGGDTERLQSVWTERNYWAVIQAEIMRGLYVVGVSAGAVVWFEAALIRNQQKFLKFINGAGLLKGSVCVHYSSEPDRKEPFSKAVLEQQIPQGIAIEDGVAVVFETGKVPYYKSSRTGHRAYYVLQSGTFPFNNVNG
jgi:peptidase E